MAGVIAILETMYAGRSVKPGTRAPRYFSISAKNHSGRRLYGLIGEGHNLIVTNACPELGRTAKCHGKPDPEWLHENLTALMGIAPFQLVLVCGKPAQETFEKCQKEHGFVLPAGAAHLDMPHPAARMWSKVLIENTARQIASLLCPPAPASDNDDYAVAC
jgi:hypothetical protein